MPNQHSLETFPVTLQILQNKVQEHKSVHDSMSINYTAYALNYER